jgi:hypothetical protein
MLNDTEVEGQCAKPCLADDLVWGGKSIAAELGISTRKAFYLLENEMIPARKVGGLWVGSRRQLRVALLGETAA